MLLATCSICVLTYYKRYFQRLCARRFLGYCGGAGAHRCACRRCSRCRRRTENPSKQLHRMQFFGSYNVLALLETSPNCLLTSSTRCRTRITCTSKRASTPPLLALSVRWKLLCKPCAATRLLAASHPPDQNAKSVMELNSIVEAIVFHTENDKVLACNSFPCFFCAHHFAGCDGDES